MKFVRGAVACLLLSAVTLAADPPFVGKWKFNAAKSSLTGDTVTIGKTSDGMMEFNSQGFMYKFKLDGKDYPTPDGGTTAWKATSADVWDVANKRAGKLSGTYHLVLKGDALAVDGKMMKPDGGSMDFSSSYKRMSGGPGFAGKWMSTSVKMPANTMEIKSAGANGITLSDDSGPISTGQFDGKDNAGLGMFAGSKFAFAFKKLSDTSFEITAKLDGKPMYVDVYTVSADGKTLTDAGTPVNAKQEGYKIIWDRQ